MKQDNRYILCRKNHNNEIVYLNYDKSGGFKFKPKNEIIYNGVKVNEMVIVNHGFIEKVLKRKIKKKLDVYLQFLIQLLDEDNETPTSLHYALNDLDRYKRTIINKYRNYLDKKYIDLLLKKIDVLERELKTKMILNIQRNDMDEEYEQERRRGR